MLTHELNAPHGLVAEATVERFEMGERALKMTELSRLREPSESRCISWSAHLRTRHAGGNVEDATGYTSAIPSDAIDDGSR